MNFIIDPYNNSQLSYDNLLNIINKSNTYYNIWKYPNFTEFAINFIKALVTNNDIVLSDNEYTENELNKIGCNYEIQKSYPNINIKNTDDLLDLIINSTSNITIFTSGTTDIPKKITHNVKSLTRMFKTTSKEHVWGMCYNPVHIAGVQVFFQSLLNLNTIVYLFNDNFDKIRNNIEQYKITHISATPTFYKLLINSNYIKHNTIKKVTIGGESSNLNLYNSIKLCFPNAKINNIYASTEIGSLLISENDIFKIPNTLTDKIKIKDNELLVHKSLLSVDIDNDWYSTGDEIKFITENEFIFLNRKNDIINVGGYKVNPIEVENLIMELEEVKDVKVYGRKNSLTGNLICAEISFKDNKSITTHFLKNYLSDKLQPYKIPKIITFVDKIKYNKNQKKIRK
jgi:acyl-coenzyme A synthetase/AMP-(fatty) acid ligase